VISGVTILVCIIWTLAIVLCVIEAGRPKR
jgi:hypothetical protein